MNGRFDKAESYLEQMRGAGLLPDTFTYNSLLSSLRDQRDLPRAELYYAEMRMQGE